jgi:HD-GYP domain-containing protein (c-di-GMP phosphodiesterase class II)
MVTDRPYRKGRAPWQAFAELERCAGTQFDPKIVAALKRVIPGDLLEPEDERAAVTEDDWDENSRSPGMPAILDTLANGDRLGL